MKTDWQSSQVISSLKQKLSEHDHVTAIVQQLSGLKDIRRAWVKKGFLCVVLNEYFWSTPVKSKLFNLLPELSDQLDVILEGVKIKKDLQNDGVKS